MAAKTKLPSILLFANTFLWQSRPGEPCAPRSCLHSGTWDSHFWLSSFIQLNHPCVPASFCTPIHKFAQTSRQYSLDVIKRKEYLPRQIEPEA
jgi:hypothetical protein